MLADRYVTISTCDYDYDRWVRFLREEIRSVTMSRTIRRNRKTGRKDRKDKDFQYTSVGCKHHGFCNYCRDNRTHKFKRQSKEVQPEELSMSVEFTPDELDWDSLQREKDELS